MTAWWEGLDIMLKVLYCIAIPASLVLIIQTVLSLVGGFSGGAGVDFSDTSGLGLEVPEGGADLGELSDAVDGGFAGDGGNPADFSTMSMFSVQGVVTFLTVFSWTTIVSISFGAQPFAASLVGIALGVVAMYLVARLIFASRRLTENGIQELKNAIGENGKVYIPVPAEGNGEGRVTMYLQGRYSEVPAIQFGREPLKTGTAVVIVDVRNGVLVVEKDK